MLHQTFPVIPVEIETALWALLSALAAPELPLDVQLNDDDGLTLIHITTDLPEASIVFDMEVTAIPGVPLDMGHPTLHAGSLEALARIGILGPDLPPDTVSHVGRCLELALLTGQHDRLVDAICEELGGNSTGV